MHIKDTGPYMLESMLGLKEGTLYQHFLKLYGMPSHMKPQSNLDIFQNVLPLFLENKNLSNFQILPPNNLAITAKLV